MIFQADLALATNEPPLSVASAKTAGVAKACFQKITASERKPMVPNYSSSTNRSPVSTCSPAATWTLETIPSCSELIVVSIFIASSVNSF